MGRHNSILRVLVNLEVQVEMNKSNTTKTKQIDTIVYCSCDGKSGVNLARNKPYELSGPRERI